MSNMAQLLQVDVEHVADVVRAAFARGDAKQQNDIRLAITEAAGLIDKEETRNWEGKEVRDLRDPVALACSAVMRELFSAVAFEARPACEPLESQRGDYDAAVRKLRELAAKVLGTHAQRYDW